jgi:hypothetical protein
MISGYVDGIYRKLTTEESSRSGIRVFTEYDNNPDYLRLRIKRLEKENYWLRMQVFKERITNNPKFDYRGCP